MGIFPRRVAPLALAALFLAPAASAQVVTVSDLSLARSVGVPSDSYLGGLDVADDGTVYAFSNMGDNIFRIGSDDVVTRITSKAFENDVFRGDLRIGRDGLIYNIPTRELQATIDRYTTDGTA